ncbi:hypothetical protein [Brevibacillus borstelensis]|uniref:hypothetical protein n=1 Tax=Brevibacillus borstelensis TaxID=45462 RepID=UPI0030BA56A3
MRKIMKKSAFARYLREQAELLEEFAQNIEDGEVPHENPIILHIDLHPYLQWEECQLELVDG